MRVGPQRMIATTGDHPQSLRDSPRQRGGQKMAQSLRGSPPGPATTDVLRTTILLLACQLLRLQTALPFAQPAAK